MPNFNKSKGFKLKSGNNPFQKNFSSPNKQRPEVQTQTDILLSALQGYGGGEGSENAGLYDDLAKTAQWRQSGKEKEIDALMADKYGDFNYGMTVPEAYEHAEFLRGQANITDEDLAINPYLPIPTDEDKQNYYREANYHIESAEERARNKELATREKEDLLAEYASEKGGGMGEAINEMISRQEIAQKKYDRDKQRAQDTLDRVESAAENRGFFEFGKKKRDQEKIAQAEEAVSAFEKSSGFKMKGSHHYGKKKKV